MLLPIYFRETTVSRITALQRCLDSILIQRFDGPFEVLIIDDGSATAIDDLQAVIGSDRLHCARIVRSPQNGGLVDALNRGLAQARYDRIARLDADDRWLEGKLAKQLALFAKDPDLTLCATGMTLVNEEYLPFERHIRPAQWRDVMAFFANIGCPFPHGSVVARTDIYRLLGGYSYHPNAHIVEDFDLWGRWIRFFKPQMIEEALYEYTVSPGSVSSAQREDQLRHSVLVHARFVGLGDFLRFPALLEALALALGISLIDAGRIAYAVWRTGAPARLPRAVLPLLRDLLPDRHVSIAGDVCAAVDAVDTLCPHLKVMGDDHVSIRAF